MANMGVSRLILVNPQCEITYSAQQAAATGQNALQNRTVYSDWPSFFNSEPDGIRISMTARDGRGRAVKDLATTLKWLSTEDSRLQDTELSVPIYLIFGPEDWGLSAEDLEFTHFACSIPTYGNNTSLNLAQAVLLALFIVRETLGGEKSLLEGETRGARANQEQVFPEATLQTWLTEMGFDLSKPKMNAYLVLKRMLLHNVPTQKELVILETVLQQSIRKLKEYNLLLKQRDSEKNR
jgi:tRNA/rRNA methyltransferase